MLDKLTLVSQKFSPGLKKVVSNIGWLFADKILQMGLSLIVGIWVARYLGPEQFGLFNYAIAFVALLGPMANLGLDTIVVRDIVRHPDSKNETLGTSLALKLSGGAVTTLLAFGAISLLQPQDNLTHWLVGIIAAGTIFQAFETIDLWFRSQVQSKYTVVVKNSAYILVCALRIALIQMQAPLIAFAWARFGELALAAVGLVMVYQTSGQDLKAWCSSLPRAKKLLTESWPLIVSGIAIYVYSTIDQIMLGSFNQTVQLGIYAAAVKISQIFDFIPSIMQISFFPKLTEAKAQGESEYIKKFQAYFDLTLILWIMVAIPVSLFSNYVVHFLYGDNYAASATVLSIYVWAQFGSGFGVARNAFIMIEGKAHNELYLTFTGASLNIILNWYLIPKYGAIGATVATLITYFVVAVLLNFIIPDLKPVGKFILRSCNIYKGVNRILEVVR